MNSQSPARDGLTAGCVHCDTPSISTHLPSSRRPLRRPGASTLAWCALSFLPLTVAPLKTMAQADPHRGLWIGTATLHYVNEVPVPLNSNNVPVAPDPAVPTPTSDQAQLRLILHVNAVGQASLLRDVAVLNRRPEPSPGAPPSSTLATDSDLALVTDPRLYGSFPPQAAVRIASAVFDFGDARATVALDEVVRRAAAAAGASVNLSTQDFGTAAGQLAARTAAAAAAETASQSAVAEADASEAFDDFLRAELPSAKVDAIAAAADPADEASDARAAAVVLRDSSFYADARPLELVDAVVAAVLAATTPAAKRADAHNTAAAYADVPDAYHRFIAGKVFGDMIVGAANSASAAAALPGANTDSIRLAVNGNALVVAARSEALSVRIALYLDTRASTAVEVVMDAVLASVATALPAESGQAAVIEQAALEAGRRALASQVRRYPVSALRPTPAYTEFVTSAAFAVSPQTAAQAAALGAVTERVNNALFTPQSLEDAALVGAVTALQSLFSTAARALMTELPLAGSFGPGEGDPRYTHDIKNSQGAPLGPAGLAGEIFLPENHPTNPFRHRQNPDHRIGFNITRLLRFDFDGSPGDPSEAAGYGVDRLTGVYREEIKGLHKLLGPHRDLGLKVEGKFDLRRISLIDALNAR